MVLSLILSIIAAWTTVTVTNSTAATAPFYRVEPQDLPSIQPDGDLQTFKLALTRQIDACRQQDLTRVFTIGDRQVTRQKWCVDTNQRFLQLANESKDFTELMNRARQEFQWYRTVGRNGKGEVLFTGYNFPVLQGSRTPTDRFKIPLYSRPDDLVQVVENGKLVWRQRTADGDLVPYPDRQAIMNGVISGEKLELAYVEDQFDAFIFEVQGAGAIQFTQPDGSSKRIVLNYAAENGRQYVALRSVLEAQGVPEEFLTIPGMRKYFKQHPEKLIPTLVKNPSYIFFNQSDSGPYGVQKILLSPGHSVAVDLRVFPVGAVAFVQTTKPVVTSNQEVTGWQPFSRLAITQDTGGAIRGPGRVDLYWGEDDYAAIAAGNMNQTGSLYLAILP